MLDQSEINAKIILSVLVIYLVLITLYRSIFDIKLVYFIFLLKQWRNYLSPASSVF